MIDIAQCNNMKVSVVIRSIYPKEFIKHLLDSHQIGYDELIVTNGNNNVIETDDKSHTCVMSNNYDFIKKYAKWVAVKCITAVLPFLWNTLTILLKMKNSKCCTTRYAV